MCLILLAFEALPGAPLVVAANRDEFHRRPTASVHFWPAEQGLLAGRDLEAGGTWLGVDGAGRFAAVTNVSEAALGETTGGEEIGAAPAGGREPAGGWRSRGALVQAFLTGSASAADFAGSVDGEVYRGFNLLLYDGDSLYHSSNRSSGGPLAPGVHAIANGGLDEGRFKVQRGKAGLAEALEAPVEHGALAARLLELLADRTPPPEPEVLPVSGFSPAEVRALGACFIVGEQYGTRASSAVVIGDSEVLFAERSFRAAGVPRGDGRHRFERR